MNLLLMMYDLFVICFLKAKQLERTLSFNYQLCLCLVLSCLSFTNRRHLGSKRADPHACVLKLVCFQGGT